MVDLDKEDLKSGGIASLLGVIIYMVAEMNGKLQAIADKLDWVFQWMAQGR